MTSPTAEPKALMPPIMEKCRTIRMEENITLLLGEQSLTPH